MTERPDWPLGPALKRARERKNLSQRAAAKRAGISDGRWRQLESGYQENKGQRIPISTTPRTVAAAARAVGWNVDEALDVAGFEPIKEDPPATNGRHLLADVPIDDLLAEIRRRVVSVRAADDSQGWPPPHLRVDDPDKIVEDRVGGSSLG